MDLNVIEFFSGIGGYRYALERSDIPFNIQKSYDINEVANSVYNSTFGDKSSNKSITALNLKDLDIETINCWLMSPPCQPFTRGGNQKDMQDQRSLPLGHLLELLKQMKYKPKYFMLENVYGFENSEARDQVVNILLELGYTIKEYLLTPLQFGMSNDRLRFYLTAIKNNKPEVMPLLSIWNDVDALDLIGIPYKNNNYPQLLDKLNCPPLSTILDNNNDDDMSLKVKKEMILKAKGFKFDIINQFTNRSACFTKAYGSRHIYSSGSLIDIEVKDKDKQPVYNFEDINSIANLNLRYFSSEEICALSGIPTHSKDLTNIKFSNEISLIQKYRLLGNSINVIVVSELIKLNFK